ncbi:MAG: VanW family protein [Clostridia bacterium]|nr:VanW family protein [Clostridia bacterium]
MQENNNNNEDIQKSPSKEGNNSEEEIISYGDEAEDDFYSFDSEEDDFDISEENDDTDISEVSEDYSDEYEEERKIEKQKAKQRRKESRRAFFKKIKIPAFVTLIVIVCTCVAFFAYALSTISPDKVMNNVYIEKLDVSGLSYEDTLASINATYLLKNAQITLTSGDKTFSINGSDIGLTALPEETADKAFNYCKTGNIFTNGFNALKLLFKSHVIVPATQVDTALLDAKLNEFGNIVIGERKQHYVEYGEDGMVTIYSGQTGYNEDPSQAREELLAALGNEQFTNIHVNFASAPPDDMTVESFDALVYKDPVNARYEINGNTVDIVPGDTGRFINKEEAAPLLQNVYEGCEPVKVPFYVSTPDVDAATLKEKLFETTLGSYSTSYGTSTANRCANIARAASLINGTVVAPGEVFSFNDTVGHRTKENGFYTAKEYVDGQSVDGIGGGTCQVSSTLYSAVLYADMNIVERLNHMMTVGYIPLGQDATVADGGVDFKFRNNSDYPVKVSAYTSGATITVSIIGTAWEPAREVKISNSSSQVGENTVVRSVRYVYSNGQLISTDTLNSSTYMPHKTE